MLTKDTFITEIKNYLYKNINNYTKEEIEESLNRKWRWFDSYYNSYINENQTLDRIKDEFMLCFQTFSFNEYVNKVKSYLNEDTNFKNIEKVDKILDKPLLNDTLHEYYETGIEEKDFYHAVNDAVASCFAFCQ